MSQSPVFARPSRRRSRSGVTLIELLVVIMVLSGMAAIVGLTWRAGLGDIRDSGLDRGAAAVLSTRTRALSAGKAITRTIPVEGGTLVITALPDGRVIGADHLEFDPLSGRHKKEPGSEGGPNDSTPGKADDGNMGTAARRKMNE